MATTRTSPPVDARALDSLLQNTLQMHRQLINRQTGHQHPSHTSAFVGLGPSALESEHSSITASRPLTHSYPIESGQNNLSGFLSSSSSTSSFDEFDTPQTSTEVNSPKDGLTIPYPIFNESINYTDLFIPDTLPSPEMTPPSTSILTTLYNQHQNEQHQKFNIREGQHQPQTGDPVTVRSPVNVSSQQPPLPPRPPPPCPPRRIKTSLTTLSASQNSKLVRHLIGNQDSPDSNTDASVIQIHVRYVPKDLWVKVDLPRDIPVHKARDMILSICRLTSLPPVDASQPPLPSQETSSRMTGSDDSSVDSRMDFKYELDRVLGQHSQLNLDVNDMMAVSRLTSMNDIEEGGSNDDSNNDSNDDSNDDNDDENDDDNNDNNESNDDNNDSNDDSSDDEEAELRAEALMANDHLFQAAPRGSQRIRTISLQGEISIMQGHRRSNSMILATKESNDKQETSSLKGESRHTVDLARNTKHNSNSSALNQQQLKRLLSYSSLHSKGGSGSTDSRDSGSYSSSRFNNIPGWSHYRSRQQSQNGIQLQREVLEHGGFLADRIDCESEDQMSSSGTIRSDCVAWKACFGLFWVAAGHWLDDSRMINSYQLQPNCLLELQLRNNYIQLPPPGGQLNYYDHYAEGILYKMSKKSGAVSKLTSHGGSASKDGAGVWKERWAVLQGTKLFLYHKRKDTTKKVIQLVVPLRITTSVLPINPRHSFKLTQSSLAPLSTTMITLTMSSDPTVPKICFRATSESEINHWTRIFHSLNDTTLHGIPSTIFSDLSPISPPALPQVQPFSPGHRQRKNTGFGEGSRPKAHYGPSGVGPHSPVDLETFSSERKRSNTSQGTSTPPTSTVPSISPLVISNAEAAFSHRRQSTGQSTKSRGYEMGKSTSIKESNDKHLRHSSSNSALGWLGGLTNTNESNSHYRNSQASTLVGSGPYSNQLSSPVREAMQRQQNIAASTEAFWEQQQRLHQEHDRRRRTVTDPSTSITASPLAVAKFKLLSPFYNHPKESRLSLKPPSPDNREASQISLDQALGIRANSPSHLRPGLGSECLDKSSKSILDSTNSSRSSLTPLYSGYVWLYIPNIPEACAHDASTGISGTKSNICITKASGRYVKCFAAINDKGQFQWVEVKKTQGETSQDEGGRVTTPATYMNKTGRRSSSRPSYAIQLSSSSSPSTISSSTTAEKLSGNNGEAIEVLTESETAVVSSRDGTDCGSRIVQASMAHKLRLYFFCIKISPASLAEVMSELSVASADSPSLKSKSSKEAPMSRTEPTPKTRSPLAGIVLPPRTTSLPSARIAHIIEIAPVASTIVVDSPTPEEPVSTTRVRAETAPAHPNSLHNSQKFPTWPSMSPLHSEKSRHSRMMKMSRTVSSASNSSTTSTTCAAAQEAASKQAAAVFFDRERTVSAPPGSYRASQLCRPGFATLGRHDSICSTRSMLQHTTFIRSNSVLTASPAVMASHRALTGAKMASKEGTFRVLPNSSSAPSLISSATLAPSPTMNSTLAPALTDLKSNVLTLAQDLQKAALTRQTSISSKSSSSSGARQSIQSGEHSGGPLVSVQSTTLCTQPKLSLSETMAVKRASLQASTAATLQSLQHKPWLGNISDVAEECELEDYKVDEEEQKQRQVLKLMCPFLEQSQHVDAQGRTYVTLKGYTETEEGWKSLHSALERFVDGPIIDQRSALPPEDTLIPSYNSPPIPEIRQSERAQNFWNAKTKLNEAAYIASFLASPSAAPTLTGSIHARSESAQGFSSLGHSSKVLSAGLSHRASLQTGRRSRSSTSTSVLPCPSGLFQRAS